MAQFLGDIAWMLELFAIAGGLVLLHLGAKEAPAKLLRAAGWLLVVAGVGTALCTGYYWFSYRAQGHFDAAYRHSAPTMMPMPGPPMAPDANMGSMHRRMPQAPPAKTQGQPQ